MTSGKMEHNEDQRALETACMCHHLSALRRCPLKPALVRAGERRLSKLEWALYNCWADSVAESPLKLELAT